MYSNDSQLLEQARQGNPAAFQQLVGPYIPTVRRFSYAFCRGWQDADDLAQEALLKAFLALGSFDGRAALSTWLFAIVRNTAIDWSRSRRGRERELEDPFTDRHAHSLQAQDRTWERREEAQRIWGALKRLDAIFRVPLVLHHIEGLTYEDIARVERVSIGTVRSRLARGRKKLKKLLLETEREGAGDSAGTSTAPLSSNSVRSSP